MAEMAPDDENSLGPDLDPPVDPFPDTPRGNLLRQIDQGEQAASSARTTEQQYRRLAETAEANVAKLRQQLADLDAGVGS